MGRNAKYVNGIKDKEDLKLYVKGVITKNNSNKKLSEHMVEDLKNRIHLMKVVDLFNDANAVLLNDNELYWICKVLNKIREEGKISLSFGFESIKLDSYFTETQIRDAEELYLADKQASKNFIVLENVVKVNDDEFVCCKCNFRKIAEAYNNGIVSYNFDSQRESELKDIGLGELQKKPKLYRTNIEEIKEDIKKGVFIPNMLTWNILSTGEEIFEYDDKKQTLMFKRDNASFMNVIDGYHRSCAITELVQENESKPVDFVNKGYMQLKIFNYPIDKAQNFIRQESKAQPIQFEKIISYEQTAENEVIKEINEYRNPTVNKMFKKITNNVDEVFKYHTKYCTYSAIYQVFEDCMEGYIENTLYRKKTTKEFTEFLTAWVESNWEDFKDDKAIKKSQKTSAKTYNAMFMLLTYLYYKAKENDCDIYEILTNFNDRENFGLEKEIWSKIYIKSSRKFSKALRSAIYNYVDEIFDSLQ